MTRVIAFFLIVCLFFVSISANDISSVVIEGVNRAWEAKKEFEVLAKIKVNKERVPYCIFPPEMKNESEPIKVEIKGIRSEETENSVMYTVIFSGVANEEGTYTIGPIKLPYVLLTDEMKAEFEKDNTRVIPTSFWEIPEFSIIVSRPSLSRKLFSPLGISILVFFVVGLGITGLVIYFYVHKKEKTYVMETREDYVSALHEARKFRLDGDYYKFFQVLNKVVQCLLNNSDSTELSKLGEKIRGKMLEVGYKGISLSESELDYYWKEVERFVLEMEKRKIERS